MTQIYAPSAFRVSMSFNSGPTSNTGLVWTDLTEWFESIQVSRGRSSELDDYQAGSCQVVFDNRDRRFDPEHPAAYFNLGPRRQI